MRSDGSLTLRASHRPPTRSSAVVAQTSSVVSGAQRLGRGFLATSWLPTLIIVAIAQLALRTPDALEVHGDNLCIAFAASSFVSLALVTYMVGRPRYPLVRRRLALIALGALAGLVIPLALLVHTLSATSIGTLSAALVLSCAFPLLCLYAARTYDLFRLDLLLTRIVIYGVVVIGMGIAELGLIVGLERGAALELRPDVVSIALGNLMLLLAVPLLHERVSTIVKRRLLRRGYSSRQQLACFSDALGGAQTVEGVRRALADSLRHTINPTRHQLYVEDNTGHLALLGAEKGTSRPLPRAVVDEMRRGNILYRYRWDDGRSAEATALWTSLGVEAFVPISTGGVMHAVLALSGKRSGATYRAEDVAFLRAAAGQAALGLTNARAFAQLRQMNTTLERVVDERTAAERTANADLQSANADLGRSLNDLQHAYSQLEQNHACLLRADRLATLGRLTAGIAHEVNTPLSAVQNALRVLVELGEEYSASIDDANVEPADHRDIAAEIITTARAAGEWATKAARFIRGTKDHGRTARATVAEPFVVSDTVDEVRTLLVHRLRVAGCTLECQTGRPGISIVGDPSAFAQVLINIVSNALDAYEDQRATNVRIVVSITEASDSVTIEVRDWAGGIPMQVLPRIFEELFTTKTAGRGTGLGLWISRNIIEKEFGGLLDVLSVQGEGSRFIASIPPGAHPSAQPAPPPSVCQNAA